jgi:hypothetical protein
MYELLLFLAMLHMLPVVEFMVKMNNSHCIYVSFAQKFIFLLTLCENQQLCNDLHPFHVELRSMTIRI